MHLWAHRAFRIGVVSGVVIIAMAVEGQVLTAPGPAALPPISAGAPTLNPSPGSSQSSHPRITGRRLPSVHQTTPPAIQLEAHQSPNPSPQGRPTSPGHHKTSPGGGNGGPGPVTPTPTVTVTTTAPGIPVPAPTPTCIVQVLTVGVCLGG